MSKKLEMWKNMDQANKGSVSAEQFVQYMDTNNPLNPSYKRQ